MESVSGHSIANHLAVDARAAAFGKFQFFQDQNAGAFADYESIAMQLEWPRSMLRIVITRGQGAQRPKAGDAHGRNCRFRAPANHGVCIATLNDLEAVTNRMRAGGTGGSGW